MLKSYAGKKIMQTLKKTAVELVSVECSVYHCLLFVDLLLVMPDGILVQLQAACQRLRVIPSLWLSPSVLFSVLPCWLSISPGPTSGSFNNPRGLPVPFPSASRGGLWCNREGGIPGSLPGGTSEKVVGVFPCPPFCHMSWSVPDYFQ